MSDFRVSSWLNTDTLQPVYGIQKRTAPRRWLNCCEDGKPLFFPSREQARDYIRQLPHRGN